MSPLRRDHGDDALPSPWIRSSVAIQLCDACLCLIADRQLADALAAGREDRISERGHHTRGARLADAAGRVRILYQVHVDARRLVYAQHAVVAEVRLLDAPVLDGDLAMQRGRQTENDAALHLRSNGVGIDLNPAIDDAPYVRRFDGAIV